MEARMRIGELARRTGVSPELLRAWEQRYGLLRPERSAGGFRLYSADDEARVRRTSALIGGGMPAAEAARVAATPAEPDPGPSHADQPVVAGLAQELRQALARYDRVAANRVLDRLFGAVSVDFVVTDVLVPYLRELGECWADGTATVAQEHFASHLIRGRLLGLAGDWGAGNRSPAVLACLPTEAHDLGLVMFGLLLARRGWDVTFLGADTPLDSVESAVADLGPSLVVLAAYNAAPFHAHRDAIARLATRTRVAIAAPVEEADVVAVGAELLADDLAHAAEQLRVPR